MSKTLVSAKKRKKKSRKKKGPPRERYDYPVEFQANVVRMILCDPGFLLSHRKAVDAEYFTDPELGWIAEAAITIFDKVKACPTAGSVLSRVAKRVPEGLDADACVTRARALYRKGAPRDAAYVTEQVVEFGRHQRLKQVIAEGPSYLADGSFDAFAQAVQDATQIAADASVSVYEYERNTAERINKYEDTLKNAVPTGVSTIDAHLQGGGIGPGEMGIFMGLPGFHKTTWLCNVGMAARERGLNVFHATFEVSAVKTARRYDCRIARMSLEKMLLNRRKARTKIEAFNAEHPGSLRIRWWPGRVCTMQELEQQIRWLAVHRDFKVGMLIADYVSKMKPAGRYDSQTSRLGIGELYSDFRSLAGVLGVPCWTAIQANRAGYSSTRADEGVLTEENAAEAFEPIRDADVVLTLNQTRAERTQNEMRVYVAKNRDGVSQQIIPIRVNPDRYTVSPLSKPVEADDSVEALPEGGPETPPPPSKKKG